MLDAPDQAAASFGRSCKAGYAPAREPVRAGAWAVESRNDEEMSCACEVRAGRGTHSVLYPRKRGGTATVLRVAPASTWRSSDCAWPGRSCDRSDAEAKPLPKAEEAWTAHRLPLSQYQAGCNWALRVRGDGSRDPPCTVHAVVPAFPACRARNLQRRAIRPTSGFDAWNRAVAVSCLRLSWTAWCGRWWGARLTFLDGREVAMSEEEILPSALVEESRRRSGGHHHSRSRNHLRAQRGLVRREALLPRRARVVRPWLQEPAISNLRSRQCRSWRPAVLPDSLAPHGKSRCAVSACPDRARPGSSPVST